MPVLADISGRLLVDVLRGIMAGTVSTEIYPSLRKITATPQDLSQRTLAPKIHKETGHIRWLEQTAVKLDRLCRGVGHQVRSILSAPADLRHLSGLSYTALDTISSICATSLPPRSLLRSEWTSTGPAPPSSISLPRPILGGS